MKTMLAQQGHAYEPKFSDIKPGILDSFKPPCAEHVLEIVQKNHEQHEAAIVIQKEIRRNLAKNKLYILELSRAVEIISKNSKERLEQEDCSVCLQARNVACFVPGFFYCDHHNKSIIEAISTLFKPLETRHSEKTCITCVQQLLIKATPIEGHLSKPFFSSKVCVCPVCRADVLAMKVSHYFPIQARRLFPQFEAVHDDFKKFIF